MAFIQAILDDMLALPHASMMSLIATFLVPAVRGAVHTTVQAKSEPKIYVHSLPNCSFDDYPRAVIEAALKPNPPTMPIHDSIVGSSYVTSDPAKADIFYIPAPFILWDNALLCQAAPNLRAPFHVDLRLRNFNEEDGVALQETNPAIIGNRARTISLWIKSTITKMNGRILLVSLGVGDDTSSYDLSLVDGCPAILTCSGGQEHVSTCSTRADDGLWHHIASTYDGTKSRLFLDGTLVNAARIDFKSSPGRTCYGQSSECGSHIKGCTHNVSWFKGETEGLRLFDYALDPQVVLNAHGGFRTTGAPCFREVREQIERSPWFLRKGGWDHFVVHGALDYPACFTAERPNAEEHYTFEQAWPAFGHFSMLHVGARAEICAAIQAGDPSNAKPECWRRFFRMVTIPPPLQGESFDCSESTRLADARRPIRVAYRGLAYSAMFERSVMANVAKSSLVAGLRYTGQVILDFTNWTFEAVRRGQCKTHHAFAGLCPWRTVGRGYDASFGSERKVDMRKRNLLLWPKSELCLVLPGDGGYELRLYSMIRLGCIPVIVYTSGRTFPKIPFTSSLPWHEFAIFWDLDHVHVDPDTEYYGMPGVTRSGMQLLSQLLVIDQHVLKTKREALLRHAASFSWTKGIGCGNSTALDFAVEELIHRANMPALAAAGHSAKLRSQDWRRKLPVHAMEIAPVENLTGNSCPAGYPVCERQAGQPSVGDVCHSFAQGVGHKCPAGCAPVRGPRVCAKVPKGSKRPILVRQNNTHILRPCRLPRCQGPSLLEPAVDANGLPADKERLRFLLISFSTRPQLRRLTWPSLRRFCDAHGDRYHLELHTEPLLDVRDYHPAWNKLAFVRRAFVMGDYHVVVWVDDDILITEPTLDPIFHHVVTDLLPFDDKVLLASMDDSVSERFPLNSGLIAWRHGYDQKHMIEKLFEIGRKGKAYMIGDDYLQPSHIGFWDQDAFAIYAQRHRRDAYAVVPHRKLQSFVRQQGSKILWQPGDFAAHFTGIRNYELLMKTVREFMVEHKIPEVFVD